MELNTKPASPSVESVERELELLEEEIQTIEDQLLVEEEVFRNSTRTIWSKRAKRESRGMKNITNS